MLLRDLDPPPLDKHDASPDVPVKNSPAIEPTQPDLLPLPQPPTAITTATATTTFDLNDGPSFPLDLDLTLPADFNIDDLFEDGAFEGFDESMLGGI